MKVFLVMLGAGMCLLGGSSAVAGTLIHDARYTAADLPAETSVQIPPGKDLEFKVSEDCADGCQWIAVYDPRLVLVNIEHKRSRGISGVNGVAEIEIEAVSGAPAAVTLQYVRMPDITKPLKSVVCTVNPPIAGVDSMIPAIVDDRKYPLAELRPVYRVIVPAGEDVEFELEENPRAGCRWQMVSAMPANCTVEIEHDTDDGAAEAEIEIRGRAAGTAEVVLSCQPEPGVTRTLKLQIVVP